MKKILALVLVLVMTVGLVSCNGIRGGILGERGNVSIVIENRDGTYDVYKVYIQDVENREEGVYGIVQQLMKREKNPLSANIVDSTYGAYVESIGSLVPDKEKNEYISIYTSLAMDFSTGEPVGVVVYDGITLKSSGVGLTNMSAAAGTVILFRIETYSY